MTRSRLAAKPAAAPSRASLPLLASPRVDPERLDWMWSLSPAEREAAVRRGDLSLGEALAWARRYPAQIPLLGNEYFFLAAFCDD